MVKEFFFAALLNLVISTGCAATAASPSLAATPPQPSWSELTVEQKLILAPLSDDWDSLEYFRQKKWLGVVAHVSSMTPWEQRRVQSQMQAWGKLSPEQRQIARENYLSISQLPIEKKRLLMQKWEEYSNLPEAERRQLKQQAAKKGILTRAHSVLARIAPPQSARQPMFTKPSTGSLTPPFGAAATPNPEPASIATE